MYTKISLVPHQPGFMPDPMSSRPIPLMQWLRAGRQSLTDVDGDPGSPGQLLFLWCHFLTCKIGSIVLSSLGD